MMAVAYVKTSRSFLLRHALGIFEFFLLWFGAACINVALDLGAGFSMGWWGFLFWVGVGCLLGWVKS